MASLWFDEPERDHTANPFDPFDATTNAKAKQEIKNRFKQESLMPSKKMEDFRNKRDDGNIRLHLI